MILKCRGQEISRIEDLYKILGNAIKGAKVKLDVWRLQQHASAEVGFE